MGAKVAVGDDRGRGILRVSDNLNPQILMRQNPCHFSKVSDYGALGKGAHEKQWTVAVVSWRTFLVHQLLSAPHRMPQEHYK